MPLKTLLGEELLGKNGRVEIKTLEEQEVIGLYFSAHWCPPCRGFTPVLADIYKKLSGEGKKFEIVFISSDRDQSSFDEYYGEMPWLALPYENRAKKNSLSKKFKVSGIPTLILVNGKGEVINKDGRNTILADQDGFPWPPVTLEDALPSELFKKNEDPVSTSSLKDKYLAIYFSAHWCPPCKMFTPVLAETYNKLKVAGRDDFEVIFVSSDKDEESFSEYFASMPSAWLALPYAKRKEKEMLSNLFGVEGIPTLVILDKDRKVINLDGRSSVMTDPDGKEFPWYPKSVNDLDNADGINETPSLCLMVEGEGKVAQEHAHKVLAELAEKEKANAKERGEELDLLFFVATNPFGVARQIRAITNSPAATEEGGEEKKEVVCDGDKCEMKTVSGKKANSFILLLDIPDMGGYYTLNEEATVENLSKFLSQYRASGLERKQLSK